MHDPIIGTIIFFSIFFGVISLLQFITEKISFPYTVSLLIFGFLAQQAVHFLGLGSEITLSSEFIFFVLLPLLLFDSAMRINFHQFRLHFWTTTFLTTFGLLVSIFIVGVGTAYLVGLPANVAFLFGAIISSTDPIAVVAIFKSLRAPKRLSLVAEGESMFNDATAVIAFRVLSVAVFGASGFGSSQVISGLSNFIYVFIGSIIFGAIAGFLATQVISKIKNDHIIETTITVALALSVFIVAEHYFHLSGVIATVMAALVVGNIGRTSISKEVLKFIDHMWEYVAFLGISLVFFFATFSLDIRFFFDRPITMLLIVLVTLLARSIAVYLSFYITNNLALFKREPNVPLSWQHILNWGGLRGVIPLVLVYSLPDDFIYKNDLINFTMASFLFTLFVNAVTLKSLLIKLKIHLPKKEEEIIREEQALFQIEESRKKLKSLPAEEAPKDIKASINKDLLAKEMAHKDKLLNISTQNEFLRSLRYEALDIEREKLNELFIHGFIDDNVYYSFETQLDLQFDALEFPEVTSGRVIKKGGKVNTKADFIKRMNRLALLTSHIPLLAKLAQVPEDQLVKSRLSLLKARVVCSEAVIEYLARLKKIFQADPASLSSIELVHKEQLAHIAHNKGQIDEMLANYPKPTKEFQKQYAYSFIRK